MLNRRPFVLVSSLAAAVAVLTVTNLSGAERGREAAALVTKSPRIDQYGDYFAMSLKPTRDALPHKADAHDIVVLFDTSASQNGEFRQRALKVLDEFLGRLGPKDRVHLFAVDVNAVRMTESFVAPGSDAMKAALDKLRRRVPLGSTDMPLALKAAAESYQPDMTNARAAVYIGDGMSVGGMITAAEMKQVSELLVEGRVPVSSFGIGPRINRGLLATVANQTGGSVGFDMPNLKILESDSADVKAKKEAINAQRTVEHIGGGLANAATEVVVWPQALQLPAELREVYPTKVPPLRGDRDTVVIGVGRASEAVEVKLSATVAGQKRDFSWTIAPNAPSDDNAYLAGLVESAKEDGGVLLSTLGTLGLHGARQRAVEQAEGLRRLAGQVLPADPKAARVLAQRAGQLDPDLQGERLIFVAQNAAQKQPAGGGNDNAITVKLPGQGGQAPGDLLADETRRRRVQADLLEREVQIQLNDANRLMAREPDRALANLKLIQDKVKRDTILPPDRKVELLQQIETAMRNVTQQQTVLDQRQIAQQNNAAIQAENRRLQEELRDREKRIEHWMAKYDSLMRAHNYTGAESVADLAQAVDPSNPEIANAGLNATMQRAIADGAYLRRQRIRGVLSTLREVEYAHIPTPDEPPITFPPKEWWDAMSARRAEYAAVSLFEESEMEKKIYAELKKPTEFAFSETPLSEVAIFIQDLHGIPINFNRRALEDAGIVPEDTLITRSVRGPTLKSGLRMILRELGLAYVIRDEVLEITSKDDADQFLITKVYPVGDLVMPIMSAQELQMSNAIGGGIGGGQQFGGGGGGGQFGGGQFGGGGGGGQFGGGGGGFFSVPSSPFRAFNPKKVPIKLESPKRDQRPAAPAATRRAAQPIRLTLAAGESFEQAWNRYFAKHAKVPVEDLRATLRDLRTARKYGEIVTVIQAALRNGQMYPWMYEAMALAMFAAESPPEDIERTLMSAADFANNATDLVYLGQYMYRSTGYFKQEIRQRFQQRALKLFRQAVRSEPTAIDAYVHGLTVAKELGDIEGIKWATVGLVNQAWTPADRRVVQMAVHVGKATLQELRKDGRHEEAKVFEIAVDKALRRDVVVVVSWTGDADVDIMVEEPTGTICSARQPRTTSGGVLIPSSGAAPGPLAKQQVQGRQTEVYVCPQGFNGLYRVALRRLWGKPTAGKVKVEVVKNYAPTGDEHRWQTGATKWVNLGDDDAMVTFEVTDGRREKALKEDQIARAAERAEQTRDQLRRELWEATDPGTFARAQEAARQRLARQPRRGFPRGGAPGFQPQIQAFPEGATFFATAVISGDRRFVRISVAPQFSFISEVNTFNFVTGEGKQQQQGGFGQGFGANPFGGGGGGGGF